MDEFFYLSFDTKINKLNSRIYIKKDIAMNGRKHVLHYTCKKIYMFDFKNKYL